VSCSKTAELIEIPFWMKTLVNPRNHVLDGGADLPREGAILGVVRAIQKHWQLEIRSVEHGICPIAVFTSP